MIMPLKKPIVFVGLMGCGKTAIGRRLAKKIDVSFVDLDHQIEKEQKQSIASLFEQYGETCFRDIEYQSLARLLVSHQSMVIASGGGAFIETDTRKLILSHSISVWIKADIDIIYERVKGKSHRPLLEKGDKKRILLELMKERSPIYQMADYHFISDNRPHSVTVSRLIDQLSDIFL